MKNRIPKQPPIDNRYVAPGCEPFRSKPLTTAQRYAENPPLHLNMKPSPGSDIGDCFDHAVEIVRRVGCVVNFKFNEVHCGVRPCDTVSPKLRDLFVLNYRREMAKTHGCKICYANP